LIQGCLIEAASSERIVVSDDEWALIAYCCRRSAAVTADRQMTTGPRAKKGSRGPRAWPFVRHSWLAALDLTIIGAGAAITGAVSQSDARSITMQNQGGTQIAFRRCTRDDAIGDEEIDAGEPDASGTDGKNPTPSAAV